MRSSALTWCWWSRGDRWMRGRTVKRARSSRRSGCKTRTHTQFLARTSARAGLSPLATGLSRVSALGSRKTKKEPPFHETRQPAGARVGKAVGQQRRRNGLARHRTPRPARPGRAPSSSTLGGDRTSRGGVRRDQLADPRVELLRDLNRPPLQQGHKTAGVRRDRPPAAPALSPDSPPPRESGAPASGLPAGARRRRLPAAPAACEGWGGS